MRETRIPLSELALIAGTRAFLGAGLALLLADRLPEDRRKVVGWTLVLVGVATTIPLAIDVLANSRSMHIDWEDRGEGSLEPDSAFAFNG